MFTFHLWATAAMDSDKPTSPRILSRSDCRPPWSTTIWESLTVTALSITFSLLLTVKDQGIQLGSFCVCPNEPFVKVLLGCLMILPTLIWSGIWPWKSSNVPWYHRLSMALFGKIMPSIGGLTFFRWLDSQGFTTQERNLILAVTFVLFVLIGTLLCRQASLCRQPPASSTDLLASDKAETSKAS